MKRRGFVGKLLGAIAVAPAVVLAKKAGAAERLSLSEPAEGVIGIAPPLFTPPANGPLMELVKHSQPGTLLPLPKEMHAWHSAKEYPINYSSRVTEQHSIAETLGMEGREVAQEKYEWLEHKPGDRPDVMYREFNYLQIVRTPIAFAGRDMMTPTMMAGEKRHALREHLRQVFYLLEMGKRARVMDREDGINTPTTTGGRQFFNSTAKGRVVYMRNRGLVWRTWAANDSDTLHGEWLSDIGWAP